MAPPTSKQSAASIDDPNHLKRFMEEMKKKSPTTFTSSQPQTTPSAASDKAAMPKSEATSDEVDGLVSPEETPALLHPAILSGILHHSINGGVSVPSQPGGRENSMVLPIRPKINGVTPQKTMVNKFLQSPHLSGLKAPPPTPESGPHSSPLDPEEISGMIQISVEGCLAGKKPVDGLAQSRHAPRPSPSSSPSQTRGILINADGYPRFKPPNRDLSPGSQRERNANFDRVSFAIADAPISSFLSRSEKAAHANYLAALEDQNTGDSVTKVTDDQKAVLANSKDEIQSSTTSKARATQPAPRLGSHPHAAGSNTSDTTVPGEGLDPVSGPSHNQHSPKKVQKEAQNEPVPETLMDSCTVNLAEPSEAARASASAKNITPASNISSMNEAATSVTRNTGWIPPHLRLPGSDTGPRITVGTKQPAPGDSGEMTASSHNSDSQHQDASSMEDSWKANASKQTPGPSHHEESSSECILTATSDVQRNDMDASATRDVRQSSPSNEAVSKLGLPEESCASSSKDTVSQSSSDQISIQQDDVSLQTCNDTLKLPPHLRFMKSQTNTSYGKSTNSTVSHTSATSVATATTIHKPSPIIVGERKSSSALSTRLPHSGISLEVPTPSSVGFQRVSPNTAWTISGFTAADAVTAGNHDLENAVFLNAWPKRGEREASTARVRKFIITGLPFGSTATFVASLVFGGPIENISVGDSSAFVLFLHAQDCLNYYNATKNGVVYGRDGRKELFAIVDLGQDVDVIGGMLQSLIELKATRCVKVNGADEMLTKAELIELANSKHRRLECIEDGRGVGPNGKERRETTFRFCCIQDAVTFAAWLRREEEWEDLGIFHSPDPCAKANGVHFD